MAVSTTVDRHAIAPSGPAGNIAAMEPFKNAIDAALMRTMAEHLQRAARRLGRTAAFDRRAFDRRALEGLEALELKDRIRQVAAALVAALSADADSACAVMEAALGPPGEGDDLALLRTGDAGLAGWAVWPLAEAVTLITLDAAPARGLQALHAMTQRATAEFAIRPFIARHPELAFAALARWAGDPSAHVRRLVSEGSRPRLPWGLRLQALVRDPSPTLPLLERLQDDPSAYVRRSVANHLNDIGKDHPAIVGDWLEAHLPGAGDERRALLRHACRGLVKQGDQRTLAAWGLGQRLKGSAVLALSAARVTLGGELALQLLLRSSAAQPQRLAIDYAVHHVKANGTLSPKVFKGWVIELAPREQRVLDKRHSLKPVTTRRYHPGQHRVDVRINGQVVAEAAFDLRV
jgi:3-methyladenine DNA glycosylase AlkC